MKKFNLAIITLLLVFQTIISPISVFADVAEPISTPPTETSEDAGTTTDSGDEGELSPPATSEEGTGTGSDDGDEPSAPSPTVPEEEGNDPVDTGDTDSSTDSPDDGSDQTESTITPEAAALPPVDLSDSVRLDVFELKINGSDVVPPTFEKELEQSQQAQGKFVFKADLSGDVKAGDFFTYSLPASLIDFNNAFNGQKDSTPRSPAFSWSTVGNLVTVTLMEDPSPDIAGSTDVGFEMNFTSGFNLYGNSLEQDLEIPKAGGGTDNVKLTFLPSSSGEKMVSKESKGVTIRNGERIIDWEVWINRAGKNLTGAKVQDTPGAGHEVVPGSVTYETYEVGLNGVAATAIDTQSDQNFEDITLNGKNAYKITYQTKVNLPIAEQEGQKTFTNTLTLIDPAYGSSDSKTATTMYGKALEKSKDSSKTSNNYVSSWEVRYNYNQAAIDQADAWIEDTLPTGHVIDTSTIKVYEMTVNDTGTATGAGTEVNAGNYTVDDTATGFKLTFTNDITKAYRITYDAKLPADFYSNSSSETMTNSVISGTVSTAKTATHTLTEGILSKSRTVDTDKKEITWSITVKADNGTSTGTDIKGLTIADTFTEGSYNAPHKLVDANNDGTIDAADINVANMTGQTISIDANGFTLTGGVVAKGQTAVITYKTAYEILPDGSIYEQGYGNTAAASWTTDKPYSITKTAHYRPESNSVNNGRKQGAYDYIEQVFNWNIKVNINKQNINNAVLEDTIGEGHEIVPGTFEIKEFTLTTPNDDEIGTEGAVLDSSLYTLTTAPDNKSFTVTFAGDLGAANNKVYIVKYQTKDSDNIVGIESTTKAEKNKPYTNTAIFTTNVGGSPRVYNLPATSVTPSYTNELITKGAPGSNSTTERLTWTLNINRSLSTLGAAKVSDVPSENQLLLKDTIKVKKYAVNANTGPSVPGEAWVDPADLNFTVTFPATGGFEIDFGELNKEGYQIQYQTLVLGKAGDPYNNEAKIDFDFATADNQETEAKYNGKFSFSASDADFSLTKGNMKFNKVGLNTLTAAKQPLANVEFELVKMVKGTPYIVATATSDTDGNVIFEDVNYANYLVREKAAPTGYELMANYAIKLDATTDTKLDANTAKVIELVNNEQVDTANACPNFTLTVKDIDGNAVANTAIKLVDSNGVQKYTGTTNASGKVSDIKRPGANGPGTSVQAGEYTVTDAGGNKLGTVIVKYGQNECHGEIQPANSCSVFTIIVKDENKNPRPNVTVTVKNASNTDIATGKTDNDGVFMMTTPPPAGTYKLYEGTIFLGTVTVTYQNGNCHAEIIQAPTCEVFTLTVKNVDGKPNQGVMVELKDKNNPAVAVPQPNGITDADGKVTITNLPPGEYEVHENNEIIGEFIVGTDCEATVQPLPACSIFTLTVKDEDGILPEGTEVTITNTDTASSFKETVGENGEVAFSSTTPSGKYEVRVTASGKLLGEFDVTYAGPCADIVEKPRACDIFTIIVKDSDGSLKENTKVIIEDSNGNVVTTTGQTDAHGEILLPQNQEPGMYTVYEVTNSETKGDRIGEVKVTYTDNCKSEVQKNACPIYTLTVNDNNLKPVGANVKVTIQDQAGEVVTSGLTNTEGKIVFEDKMKLQQGQNYAVYNEAGIKLGDITVSYVDNVCGAVVQIPYNACPIFTLTIQDIYGTNRPYVEFTIKDLQNNTIAAGKTNEQGIGTIPYTVQPGTYRVYDGNLLIATIIVTDGCAALAKPSYTGGGGGWTPDPGTPVDPNKPTPDPEKPVDPNKPTPDPEKPVDPNNPTPDPEKPVDPNNPTPDPEKPVDPNKPTPDPEKPVDPNKPTPDPEKPVDPNNPTPDPEKPVDSNNPATEPEVPGNPENPTTDSNNPVNPGKTESSKPSVKDIIDQGKNLPSYNPSTATKDTLDAYKDFLDKFNSLTKEEQAEIAKSLDIDKIKAAAKQLESQLNKAGKLPQTDGADQTALTLLGAILVLGACYVLRRRESFK
ncbi:collagen binding domain-containing protein [Lysinibacillus sp. 3P01SB]|uniref:collagen binding domain-containing protein n=1 Tax=Lysinibacillus sp. 3P01SB TaxID=3132284 RepID=UPI0039A55198